ncbi:hypothetical protein WI87_22320 [Burkholderia ubonensis]|nr:hypothetical protein WI87_22320 [Burkholderia ubonensis]
MIIFITTGEILFPLPNKKVIRLRLNPSNSVVSSAGFEANRLVIALCAIDDLSAIFKAYRFIIARFTFSNFQVVLIHKFCIEAVGRINIVIPRISYFGTYCFCYDCALFAP